MLKYMFDFDADGVFVGNTYKSFVSFDKIIILPNFEKSCSQNS